MTATYVYGIVRASSALAYEEGVLGGPVLPVTAGDVAALTSQVPGTPIRAKRRDVLSHSDVLQKALANGPVLPMRFGTVFDSDTEVVERLLGPSRAELRRLLDEFDGKIELRVRASYIEERVLAEIVRDRPAIGRLQKESRSQRGRNHALQLELGQAVASELEARRRHDAASIIDGLSRLAREVHVDEPWSEYDIVRASFLVRDDDVKKFDAALAGIAREHEGRVHFKCIGPLPPHSFVTFSPS